jgi:hypothetical protein
VGVHGGRLLISPEDLETFFEHGDLEERGRMTEGGVKA